MKTGKKEKEHKNGAKVGRIWSRCANHTTHTHTHKMTLKTTLKHYSTDIRRHSSVWLSLIRWAGSKIEIKIKEFWFGFSSVQCLSFHREVNRSQLNECFGFEIIAVQSFLYDSDYVRLFGVLCPPFLAFSFSLQRKDCKETSSSFS